MIKSPDKMVAPESNDIDIALDYEESDAPLAGVFRPWMLILGLLIVAAYQFHFINFTWDDPFITWRYAENFAHGHGLVFNIGERVEGYSNLLYVLLFALLAKLHIYWGELRLVYPAKIIGSITSLALIWLTVKYSVKLGSFRRLGYPKAALIIGFIAVSNIFLHLWAMCGMETILYPLLVLLANLFLISGIESVGHARKPKFIYAGVIFFLACITRPDGFIMTLSALLFVFFTITRKRMTVMEGLHVLLAWLIPSLIVLGWRYSYYGDIFPMSYYSKATGGWEKIRAGGYQWWFGANQVLGHWILFAVMYVPIFTRRGNVGPAYFLLFCQTLFYQFYVVYSGFDFLWANRFFTHMLPLLQLMLFAGICEIFRFDPSFKRTIPRWDSFEKNRLRAIALMLGLLVVLGYSGNAGFYRLSHWDFQSGFKTGLHPEWALPAYYDTGMWMKAELEPTDRAAIGDIGLIPYVSDVRVLDCFGLADEYIARLPGDFFYEKFDIDYILGDKPGRNETPPDYIVLMGYLVHGGRDFNPAADKFLYMSALWADRRFHENYELVKRIDFFLVYKHRGLDRGPEPDEATKRWYSRISENGEEPLSEADYIAPYLSE